MESNEEFDSNPQFSSVMLGFSLFILTKLSSLSKSIQPGLIIWVGLNPNSIRLMLSTASEQGLVNTPCNCGFLGLCLTDNG